jgi:hypothetical protein
MRSRLIRLIVFFTFCIVANPQALALDSESTANANDPPTVWMAYCSSFSLCKMVAIQSDAETAGVRMVDKIKNYLSTIGQKPAMGPVEFREYLKTLSASERQDFIKRCTLKRGDSGKDICENDYLLDHELRALNESRRTQNAKSKHEQLKDERAYLVKEDTRLHEELIKNCNTPELQCSIYSSDGFTKDILRLQRGIEKLNQDPEYKKNFGALDSKAIAWTSVTQQINDTNITPKAPDTSQNTWKDLPTRNSNDHKIDLNVNDKTSFQDPYSGVSSQLSQEKINEKAGSWKLVTDTIISTVESVAKSASESEVLESGSPSSQGSASSESGKRQCGKICTAN